MARAPDRASLVREEPALRGFCPEWMEPGRIVVSRGNTVLEAATLGGPLTPLGRFPVPAVRSVLARLRPVQRLLRHVFYNVLPLGDGVAFVTFGKQAGLMARGDVQLLDGMRTPCRVLRGGCALGSDGTVYFGEYRTNDERSDVAVYRYVPGASAIDVAHVFPAGQVRHVHGIYRDPWTDALWCLAGDRGAENRVMRADHQFQNLEIIGAGDESWRAVSIQFTHDAIYYATDAEFTQNFIYRIDRTTGRREQVVPVGGPVYYSCARPGALFFAVTAELCPSQQGRSAALWRVGDDGSARQVFAMEKDRWQRNLFGHGTIDLPGGPGVDDRLYFHTTALEADDHVFSIPTSG